MTLLLKNDDLIDLANISEMIDAIENVYEQMGKGQAVEHARRRIYQPKKDSQSQFYWFNHMSGLVDNIHTAAMRINSASVAVQDKRGNARLAFPGAFAALVLLFDTETNELIAVLQDFYLNPIRVAATSAVVTRRLARSNSKVMGLFGSGTQAILQAECTAAVVPLEEIRVYSTRPERRKNVAERIGRKLGIKTIAVERPQDAVEGCDIVTTATSSNEPVFDGAWVAPGTHVNTMIGSDSFLPRRETDDVTVLKSDLIVVNSRESIFLDRQPELYPHLQSGRLRASDIVEIGELLTRRNIFGRGYASQITYHNNNVGMGIQFAGLGRLLYTKAVEKGIGTEIDSGFFMQYDDDLRRIRDQGFL